MSLKHLQLHKNFITSTANDTEISTYCSDCQSTPSTLKSSEITRRNCVSHLKKSVKRIGHPNTMFHKFLLIYVVVFAAFSPLILCMRHQDESDLSLITPSTNSIDTKEMANAKSEINFDYSDDAEDEESDEDQIILAQADVREGYEKQFKAFAKNFPVKNEIKNSHATTMKPTRSLSVEGSCLSTACLARKDIEIASTESIRKHILMKLGMEHEPNKTNYTKLTDEDRELLCKKFNISPEKCLGKKMSNVEYQSDDPIDSHYDDYGSDRDVITEEEDVQFLSYENRIYAFPSSTYYLYLSNRTYSFNVFIFNDDHST